MKTFSFSANIRRLFAVGFTTFFLVAFIFIFTFYYYLQVQNRILKDVNVTSVQVVSSSELNRSLLSLELDIRKVLIVIFQNPGNLLQESQMLFASFDQLLATEISARKGKRAVILQQELKKYRAILTELIGEYIQLIKIHKQLEIYHDTSMAHLRIMEENTGKLMLEYAMRGKKTESLQQLYALIPLSMEYFLQSHMLIDTSVNNLTPSLLGLGTGSAFAFNDEVADLRVSVNINSTQKLLETMMSAESLISDQAVIILDLIPDFLTEIQALHEVLLNLEAVTRKFEIQRDATLSLLDKMDDEMKSKVLSIQGGIKRHTGKFEIIAKTIFIVVLITSFIGLILIWKISRELEGKAAEVTEAKEFAETASAIAQREVIERRSAEKLLQNAKEGLEIRVNERTKELSASNAFLYAEVQERKKSQAALREEKERLAVTLKSIADGVIATDINGKVLLINEVAAKLIAWPKQEAAGKALSEIFVLKKKKDQQTGVHFVHDVLKYGKETATVTDNILLDRNGNEKNIADSCAPIKDKSGQVIGAILVFRDVTEKFRMEEQLLKVRKLESVGILAGGIAHDFNNILSAILGNLNLSQLYLNDENQEIRELISDAERATLRARDLTKQLLTFSKGGEPIKKIASIRDIIVDSAEFVLRGSNVKCQFSFPDGLWHLEFDEGQVSQVIQNIILNGSHAMPEGGLLEVMVKNVLADKIDNIPVSAGEFVEIIIRDHGIGMTEDIVEKIFDPYFSTKQKGSGLGLAITHSIVSKHGGYIWAESEPGTGSAFYIYFPALSSAEIIKEIKSPAKPEIRGSGFVLIMDDEKIVRKVARKMLAHFGYQCLEADDGVEALNLYQSHLQQGGAVEFVIMDLTIPGGMGGEEAAKKLLEIYPEARIIVASGYSNDPILAHYQEYGFVNFVHKPFELEDIRALVAEELRQSC